MNTTKKPSCLVVDDETDLSELLVITLNRMGIHAQSADNLDDAKFMLRQHSYDLCLTDMRLPDGNGLDLVRHITQHYAGLPIAVITAFGSAENAVSALKAGAFDYITKPISLQQLRPLVQSALKLSQPQAPLPATEQLHLIGSSPAIEQVRSSIEQYARSEAPVYISGETGSGKELAARLIHQASSRQDGPFVAVKCSSITESTMETAFFGHKKGAFAGALQDRQGYFQAANGGILFLDEVSDLPLTMQIRLLKVIQDKRISVPGAAQDEALDVRFISATHRDLNAMMEKGSFRQDLYYRLNVINLKMPPLRDMLEDIPAIVNHVLDKLSKRLGVARPKLAEDALPFLQQQRYMGNVRELENILERALALSEGKAISAEQLTIPTSEKGAAIALDAQGIALPDLLENIEKHAILEALKKTSQNKTAAAKLLGVSFRTLRYRLVKLGLSKEKDVESDDAED